MGHKIHPTGLRLGITQEHRSRWYAPSKTYPTLLQEDDRIRKFIHKKYGEEPIAYFFTYGLEEEVREEVTKLLKDAHINLVCGQ